MWRAFLKVEIKTKKSIVEEYMDAFQALDHPRILACLSEDVEWIIHGHTSLKGKKEFEAEIENKNFEGKPFIQINRLTEESNVVIAEGTVRTKPKNQEFIELNFIDVFEFEKSKIKKLESHLSPIQN